MYLPMSMSPTKVHFIGAHAAYIEEPGFRRSVMLTDETQQKQNLFPVQHWQTIFIPYHNMWWYSVNQRWSVYAFWAVCRSHSVNLSWSGHERTRKGKPKLAGYPEFRSLIFQCSLQVYSFLHLWSSLNTLFEVPSPARLLKYATHVVWFKDMKVWTSEGQQGLFCDNLTTG